MGCGSIPRRPRATRSRSCPRTRRMPDSSSLATASPGVRCAASSPTATPGSPAPRLDPDEGSTVSYSRIAPVMPAAPFSEWLERLLAGRKLEVGEALTVVERGGEDASRLLDRLRPHTGRAQVIGVTGP